MFKNKQAQLIGLIGVSAVALYSLYRLRKGRAKKQVVDLSKNSLEFRVAVEQSRQLTDLSTEEQLILYGMFKQAVFGDCNIKEPMSLEFEQHAKWEAWQSCKGVTREEVEEKYCQVVDLLAKHGGTGSKENQGMGLKVSTMQKAEHDTNEAFKQLINTSEPQQVKQHLTAEQQARLEQLTQLLSDPQKLEQLLAQTENLEIILKGENEKEITLLHDAVDQGLIDTLKVLLPYYTRLSLINQQESVSGMTGLHYACLGEDQDLIKLLIDNGADATIKDYSGLDSRQTINPELIHLL